MKNVVLIISAIVALFFTAALNAQDIGNKKNSIEKDKTECTSDKATTVLKVEGKCGMCKNKIEGAALSVDGVHEASYDITKKELTLKHTEEACMRTVQQNISDKGYDTQEYRASLDSYNSLPDCCRYRD